MFTAWDKLKATVIVNQEEGFALSSTIAHYSIKLNKQSLLDRGECEKLLFCTANEEEQFVSVQISTSQLSN